MLTPFFLAAAAAAAAAAATATHCHTASQVIKLISRVIADFANGEISQASSLFDTQITLQVGGGGLV
jgi:hypothetical protein